MICFKVWNKIEVKKILMPCLSKVTKIEVKQTIEKGARVGFGLGKFLQGASKVILIIMKQDCYMLGYKLNAKARSQMMNVDTPFSPGYFSRIYVCRALGPIESDFESEFGSLVLFCLLYFLPCFVSRSNWALAPSLTFKCCCRYFRAFSFINVVFNFLI